jgi:hypothetical protein
MRVAHRRRLAADGWPELCAPGDLDLASEDDLKAALARASTA